MNHHNRATFVQPRDSLLKQKEELKNSSDYLKE